MESWLRLQRISGSLIGEWCAIRNQQRGKVAVLAFIRIAKNSSTRRHTQMAIDQARGQLKSSCASSECVKGEKEWAT